MQPNVLTRSQERLFDVDSFTKDKIDEDLFKQDITPYTKGQSAKVRCSTCRTTAHKLRICQRCQSTHYCSRECQKKHWPTHKSSCVPVDRSNPFKLLKILASNPQIMQTLEIAIAVDLDLANDTEREIGFKRPFIATIDVGIEPWDMSTLGSLLLTNLPVPEHIDAVVQVHSVHCGIPGRNMPHVDLGPWTAAREVADNTGSKDLPIGLFNFSLNGVGPFTLVGHAIQPYALEYARERYPMLAIYVKKGKVKKKEDKLSVATCLSFINSHIRADTDNQLKLRTMMTKSDIVTIKNAMDLSINTEEVVAFRERVARLIAPSLDLA